MTKAEKEKLAQEQAGLQPGTSNDGAQTNTPDPIPPIDKKGPKKIEVNEDTLRELIEQNKVMSSKLDMLEKNAVATGPNNGMQIRKKALEHDYILRKWDDKYVLGFENVGREDRPLYVYNVYNEKIRMNEQFVNLVLEDEKQSVKKIPYIDFLRDSEKVKARKIKEEPHETVKEYGFIPKKDMAENGYGMFETMVMVPVEVVSKEYTFTLKVPEGREILVDSKWVNM